jgi:hypothetical protein
MELGAQLDRTNAEFFAGQDIRRTQATGAEQRLSLAAAAAEERLVLVVSKSVLALLLLVRSIAQACRPLVLKSDSVLLLAVLKSGKAWKLQVRKNVLASQPLVQNSGQLKLSFLPVKNAKSV